MQFIVSLIVQGGISKMSRLSNSSFVGCLQIIFFVREKVEFSKWIKKVVFMLPVRVDVPRIL